MQNHLVPLRSENRNASWRSGWLYTLAVEAETAPGRAQRRFTTICLCRDEIRCHDETVREPMIVPPSVPKNALVREELLLRIPFDWETSVILQALGRKARRIVAPRRSIQLSPAPGVREGPHGVHSYRSDLLCPRSVWLKRLFRTPAHQTIGSLVTNARSRAGSVREAVTASPGITN